MTEESFKRKLTAILSADVEGYSRLMGEDEDATIRTLTSYRELMSTLIQKHRGRVVDSPGDNLLAEFLSVVDAVRCAVEVQEELRVRNAELPENRRMEFRIGINLGDVVQEEERIYGDGINIAARVEGIAEGGGICISGTVYDSIKNKLSLSYESLGEHTVKNIKEPVRVYRMRIGPEAVVKTVPRRWHKAALAAVAVLVLAVGAWAIWNFYFRPPPIEPASVEKMAYPLPDKPSIAVLAFDNLSGDPEQEYIADGISENIITALSHIPRMFVIARNSSFTYKGKAVKVQQISEELGVRYILEGSVLISEEKIRITAQLIDALTGGHIWSERYDRDFNDLLNLLDEITLAIGVALQVELTEGEQARIVTTDNLDAWRYVNKGTGIFYKFSKEAMLKSRELFKKALEIDPDYAGALTMLAWTHWNDAYRGYTDSKRESFKRAVELAKKSVALDDNQPLVHELLLYIHLIQKQHDKAIEEGRKALALGPNRALGHNFLCEVLYRSGYFEEAVQMCEKAIRLHPYAPPLYLTNLCTAYYWVGRYEESLTLAEQVIEKGRRTGARIYERWGYWCSARAKVRLGREGEAREDMAKFLEIAPGHNMELDRRNTLYKPEIIEQEHDDMRKAGFPEHPALPLPDKPSIAVLPFTNISGDPEQEYFADGMTDDLITDLSKIAGLFVIARNSVFTYKGKSVNVKQIGRDLGVRYVLEGSVRKADNQVRINAQLIDTTTGGHLWAERYDGEMANIFDLQDKINQKITSALAVKLTVGEKALVGQKGTNDPAAYEELLKGRVHYLRNTTEDFTKAEACFKRAIQLDPNYGQARAALAMLYWFAAQQRKEAAFKISYVEARLRARQYLREAMKEPTSIAYQVAGLMDLNLRQHDEAISQLEKALALDPKDPACLATMSKVLSMSGRPAEGLEYAKDAMRLDPLNPGRYLAYMGIAHFCMGEWQETVTVIEKALKLNPELRAFAGYLASAYAHLGRDDEAKAAAQTFRRGSPSRRSFDALPPARRWMFWYPFKDRRVADSFLESLKRVGLLAPGPEYIHVSKKDQLTGAELRAFYCPSTITGLSVRDGSVWSVETTKDGTITYRANFVPGGVDTGKRWFEGDKTWIQLSKMLFGMAACQTTFKNPRGTHEGKDEYVQVSDLIMSPFSRVR